MPRDAHDLFAEGYRLQVYMPQESFVVETPRGASYIVTASTCQCHDHVVQRQHCKHLACLDDLVDAQLAAHDQYARTLSRRLSLSAYERRLLHMGAKPEAVLSERDARTWRQLGAIEQEWSDLLDTYLAIRAQRKAAAERAERAKAA